MTPAATQPLSLDGEVAIRIERLAETRHRSAARLLNEAVVQFVDREEARDRLCRDAMEAWDEFQANGQHVTAEEADLWLARLEAGHDEAPPECHG